MKAFGIFQDCKIIRVGIGSLCMDGTNMPVLCVHMKILYCCVVFRAVFLDSFSTN